MALDLLLTRLRGRAPIPPREALRAGLGAGLGVAACGLAARLVIEGRLSAEPLLIAPLGASAVLMFAIPASPLAQPRAVIGGNVIAALAGVACAALIPQAALAAAAAVALAILLMALAGCLHPPGGAIALGAALAAAGGRAPGLEYALAPVGLGSVLLVGAAIVWGRLSGRSYPHRVAAPSSAHGTTDPKPADRVGYTAADLDRALEQYGELLDVSREDLDALFRQVELEAHRRLHARIRCEEIMSRDVISVGVEQSCESALTWMRQHDLRTAPAVDGEGRVVGMVRRAELQAGRDRRVETVLDPFVHKVRPGTPVQALLPLLSSGAAHEVMVVDEARRLIGVITQTDLLAVLYRAHVVEAVVARSAA
ncbi:MAG: HPP family protein [Phenylobacterium zucineum]|nr:MAG: HPP family protein [Phenylobacterium zucineum]